MGNRLIPRKITLVGNTNTLLTSDQKRGEVNIFNDSGARLGLTPSATEVVLANCYPLDAAAEFTDHSNNAIYGLSVAGGDVYVWEHDI